MTRPATDRVHCLLCGRRLTIGHLGTWAVVICTACKARLRVTRQPDNKLRVEEA